MDFQTHTFKSGIKLIFCHTDSPITHCGMIINAGSRDENDKEHGMAHFVEHMLFKGTKKRRPTSIINRLENVGGELNAYTSKEETVVYASIMTEYAGRAIELITDIVFHSLFLQKEIEKELVIIFDEIQSYNDSPSELIFDDFENMIFGSHSMGHNILGSPHQMKDFKTVDTQRFVMENYLPYEMVFFLVGNQKFDKIVKICENSFDPLDGSQNVNISPRVISRIKPSMAPIVKNQIKKNTFQTHCIIGGLAYDLYHPHRIGMFLLNNIIGGPGMNSLLNLSLRERNALVYNVESNFQPFTDCGTWSIYFGCDPENFEKCKRLIYRELKKNRDAKISATSLKKYKLQFLGQLAISNENKESLALTIGKSFMRYGVVDQMHVIREKINSITPEQLQIIANEVFQEENIFELKYI